jgi:hypothetical protein
MAYRYKTVKRGGKTVLLHRHIAEQVLGRPLASGEHVHHGNEDRRDNRPSNLQVLPAEQHHQLHADERLRYPRTKRCEVCGTQFTPHPTKRKRAKTCSKPCADALRSRTERETKAALVRANLGEMAIRRAA